MLLAQNRFSPDTLWQREYRIWQAADKEKQQALIWQAFESYCREGLDSLSLTKNLAEQLTLLNEVATNRQDAYYNAAVYFMKQNRYEDARYWWDAYSLLEQDSSCAAVWMALCLQDTLAQFAFNRIANLNQCATCFKIDTNITYSKRDKWLKASAYLFPGLGMALKGYPREGITALLLSGGLGYGVYTLWQSKLYINAIGIGSLFFLKFYTGNIQFTQRLLNKKAMNRYNKTALACRQGLNEAWTECPAKYR